LSSTTSTFSRSKW